MHIDISKHLLDNTGYSSHLKIIRDDEILVREVLKEYRDIVSTTPKFLDVGGGSGRHSKLASGYDYFITDIIPRPESPNNIVVADITDCPNVSDNTYDIVFSNNVFEHIKEPWKAGVESIRILKPNGIIICIAPFSWRYHPVPIDTFRYSHTGMQILFQQNKNVKTIFSGYCLKNRRADSRGFWKNGLDKTPIDKMGGWREQWETIYIGQKIEGEIIEELDSDYSINH